MPLDEANIVYGEKLGEGGQAEVYRATLPGGRQAAIKHLKGSRRLPTALGRHGSTDLGDLIDGMEAREAEAREAGTGSRRSSADERAERARASLGANPALSLSTAAAVLPELDLAPAGVAQEQEALMVRVFGLWMSGRGDGTQQQVKPRVSAAVLQRLGAGTGPRTSVEDDDTLRLLEAAATQRGAGPSRREAE